MPSQGGLLRLAVRDVACPQRLGQFWTVPCNSLGGETESGPRRKAGEGGGAESQVSGFQKCGPTPSTAKGLTRASLGFLQPPQVVSSSKRSDRARTVAQRPQGLEQLQVRHGTLWVQGPRVPITRQGGDIGGLCGQLQGLQLAA